jgi:Na+/proline symporter
MLSSSMTKFHWADYLVFAVSLGVVLVIGVIFMIRGRKAKNTKEYLLGGKNMNMVLVGISMMASGINAIFLLGVTAEVYYR